MIASSTDGIRGVRAENEQLKEDLSSVEEQRNLLDLWNAENTRILTAQDERMKKMRNTDQIIAEQEAKFKKGRRSWWSAASVKKITCQRGSLAVRHRSSQRSLTAGGPCATTTTSYQTIALSRSASRCACALPSRADRRQLQIVIHFRRVCMVAVAHVSRQIVPKVMNTPTSQNLSGTYAENIFPRIPAHGDPLERQATRI